VDEVVFGRYRLLSLIGEGGMGKVYRAHDTTIDRDVAIKLLPADLGADPAYRERFRREAHTAARLTEPHIIPIYDTGDVNGRLYLVMPIIEGTDLEGLLVRDGPMDPGRAVHIIEQLAAALGAAHAAGLVHRDVKPSNALVTGQDFVYLIDFGVARGATSTKLTSTGVFMGTLAYMAPERFSDGIADGRSDIYALACVLHECLTGKIPYPGNSMEQQIAGHLMVDPPRPSEHRALLPVGFDEVIATGMAKDPDQRYATTAELASAARAALITAPAGAQRIAPGSRAAPTRAGRLPNLPTDQLPLPPEPGRQQPAYPKLPANQHDLPAPLVAPPPRANDQPTPGPIVSPRPRYRPGPIVVVAVTVAVLAIGSFVYLSRSDSRAPAAATAQSESPSGPTVSPVADTALQGLLLSPGQLDTATGATGMTITGSLTTLPDGSGQVPDKACVPLEGAGQATVYAGSGFSTVSGQRAADQSHAHIVQQIVVSFPSAQDARTFFDASAQRWPTCASRSHDETTPAGQTEAHAVGPVSNTNGTLSATVTGFLARNGSRAACERALTVANNVAIDIDVCGENPSGAAVNIADQIAAKVPAQN
jgi:serine/threonine protein kinase